MTRVIWARTFFRLAAALLLLGSAACPGSLPDPLEFEATDAGALATIEGSAPEAGADGGCPDVPALLAQSCGTSGCHDSTTKAEALDLVSPDVTARLVGVPASEGAGLLIDPGTPSDSVLYTKLLPNPPFGARMPTGGTLDEATTQCVLAWVTSVASASGADAGVSTGTDAGTPAGDAMDAMGSDAGATAFTTLRIAAGQTSAVTDAQGNTWSADVSFTGGTAAVQSPPTPIAGTDTSALYNGQRYGDPAFSYQFTVPDGAYTVTLKFAEQYVTGPGLRLFDIAINGAPVETQFDIYAAAGAMNTAVDRAYPVTVSGGTLSIAFTPGTIQSPKVDAIEVSVASGGTADGGS
jgi:hypothetical protein